MTIQQLDVFFTEYGYKKIPSNLPDYSCYFRIEDQYAVVCNTMRSDDRFYLSSDEYRMLRGKISELFAQKGIAEVHILTLVLAENWQNVRKLCTDDPFCWMISPTDEELVVPETQVSDFYGLRDKINGLLLSIRQGTYSAPELGTEQRGHVSGVRSIREWWDSLTGTQKKALPWVSLTLVIINTIIYIFCSIYGSAIYDLGSLSVRNIENDSSFYRLISSMFLHADLNHLTSNMIILFYVGEAVEKKTGHIRFSLLYFIAGLVGGFFSIGTELYTHDYFSTVGASGAIFGIIGGLLFLVIAGGGRIDEVTTGRIVFIIAFSLYTGFTSQGINNAAHVGGLLGGIATMSVMWALSPKLRNSIYRRQSKGAGHEV